MPSDMLLILRTRDGGSRVLAGTGYYAGCAGRRIEEALTPELLRQVDATLSDQAIFCGAQLFVASAAVAGGGELVAYIAGAAAARPVDTTHVGLLCRHIAAGFDNLRLQRELKQSQRSLVLLLATALEQRVVSQPGHGQRVGSCLRLLGELVNLPDEVLEWLPLAATLHDLGQIAIPEAILNKREALTPDEQALFETHTRWGQDLLGSQDSEILQMAGLIAAQHHERWDGRGYPARLAGAQIHLYARLAAIADAFDEAIHGSQPVTAAEAIAQIRREGGRRFDPDLVDVLVRNTERFKAIAGE